MKCEVCETTATISTSCRCGKIRNLAYEHYDAMARAVRENPGLETFGNLFGPGCDRPFETGSDPGDETDWRDVFRGEGCE